MVKRKRKEKRWKKDWHHRVPDFQLVYCGPKNNTQNKENQRKRIKVSITTEKEMVVDNLKKNRK